MPATGGDPLANHRLPDDVCEAAGVIREGLTLEIDTGLCRYAFYEQPLLADVQEGEPIEIVFWHSDLVALELAEAHMALLIDGSVLWERALAIPGEPCAYTDVIAAPASAEVGSTIQLHLHNHGANTWNLLRVHRAEPATALSTAPSCD